MNVVTTGSLTIAAALQQSRLPAAQQLPGKEFREVCIARRVYGLSELLERSLDELFSQSACGSEARAFANALLSENNLPPMRP